MPFLLALLCVCGKVLMGNNKRDKMQNEIIETLVTKLLSSKSDDFERMIAYTRLVNLGMNDDDIVKYGIDTGKIMVKDIPAKKLKKRDKSLLTQ